LNQESSIYIRDIEGVSDLRSVEALQKEVWRCADLDVAPLTMFVATREVGALLIGAYDGSSLVGFVYGFPGYERGQVIHHSHMLAVSPAYRNHQLGFKLKLAQRERALAQGINRITWTFDPLQSLNAHLNFDRLGVVADTYKINFYGEATSSFLHQMGTDRLWVTWLIDSERVRRRLESDAGHRELIESDHAPALVENSSTGEPTINRSSDLIGGAQVSIEVPGNINYLQRDLPELAATWREATRSAFTAALDNDYLVTDFYRVTRNHQSVGVYRLTLRDKVEDSAFE
jgi:predicted GNAT superfamily acetyltransferase